MTEIEFKLLQSLRASNLRDEPGVKRADQRSSSNGSSTALPRSSDRALRSSDGALGAEGTKPASTLPSTSRRSETRVASIELLYGELTEAVIGAAIQVHRWLGPGQLESTYQRALAKELAFCGIHYRAQVPITSWYRDEPVGEFFADFIVEDKIILELKVASRILPVHRAQLVSYLRATDLKLGLILNFQVPILTMGIKRVSP